MEMSKEVEKKKKLNELDCGFVRKIDEGANTIQYNTNTNIIIVAFIQYNTNTNIIIVALTRRISRPP